ncbi:hypothetical protein HOD29_02595 [archaeon]|jgi:hypothetical protein|nr:hypothetical protein [archaeon]
MHKYYGSERSWAEKVIENAKTGNPAGAACLMHKDGRSSKEWYEKVKQQNK